MMGWIYTKFSMLQHPKLKNMHKKLVVNPIKIIFPMILVCLTLQGFTAETDTINSTFALKDPDTIISPIQRYKLGFFSPQNNINRYLAIFFVVSESTVIWVANRDKPLTDSSVTVTIRDGNLVLVDGQNETVWSTNVTSDYPMLNTTARILDTGNLVITESSTGNVMWESFSQPTNVAPPLMPLIDDTRTGRKVVLTSWTNVSNPGKGDFETGLQALRIPQLVTWHSDGTIHYRTGPWNGQIWIGLKDMYTPYLNRLNLSNNSGIVSVAAPLENYAIMTLNSSGNLVKTMWNDQTRSWDTTWIAPIHECDVYGKCGSFGICNIQNSPRICSCLGGFEPMNIKEWESGNWKSGCIRKKALQCNMNSTNTSDGDEFLRLPYMKVPDFPEPFPSNEIDECRVLCLSNCSCIAYAYDSNSIGCMFWRERDGLIDIQQFPGVGVDLYIRLAASELGNEKDRKLLIIVPTILGFVLTFFIVFIGWCWVVKQKGARAEDLINFEARMANSSDSIIIFLHKKNKTRKHNIRELPLFSFKTLSKATKQFHDENILGKGGFGHVYKGKLRNGQEIAIKRLSEASRQGTEEFMNEMILISKLQHRNLVRLIGCCVEKGEKMLIYEYLPNKCLDGHLFDSVDASKTIIHWKKRITIIEGIGRGLLYLHRDSRLRIIHRDLKPSNVLLDEEWNPKISDFGMARIFSNSGDQGNTDRVVGTYGYMAPEYAVHGRFSEKSDVFSFGVLMLEILSGKKITHYYNHDLHLGLVGLAWKSWNEDDAMAFVDEKIATVDFSEEMLRCICIALLCVQDYAEDRPTIQTALSMLSGEIVGLPVPKQPVFAEKWKHSQAGPIDPSRETLNELTITRLDGR